MDEKAELAKLAKLGEGFIYSLIDNPYECPIIIDNKGIIRFMSRYSKKLIKIDPDEAVGKHIVEIIPETHLHEILKDGKARIGDTLFIGGRQQVITRIPLKDMKGKIIGAVGKGIFNETSKVLVLNRRIEQLNGELQYLQKQLDIRKAGTVIIGESPQVQAIKASAFHAARSNASVLITGESGTGKEVIAQYIHQCSPRAKGPFIRVNCASIPSELFESELFGYDEGAFTGARTKGKPGKFELANGGTIFLDEIAELPLPMQAKLLRVLQEKAVDRLGATKLTTLDFRLVAATNRDLLALVKNGLFRMDLYFRIDVFQIQAASLREIKEDIPLICMHLMSLLKDEIGTGPSKISVEAMDALRRYTWPGNVRELRNVLERALIVANGDEIQLEDLPKRIRSHGLDNEQINSIDIKGTLRQLLEEAEKQAIRAALHHAKGNKVKAAKALGIHRSSLYEKLNRLPQEELTNKSLKRRREMAE